MKIHYPLNKTKIIATMGPSFDKEPFIKKMLLNGVTTIRLNISHGDYIEHGRRLQIIKKLRKELDLPISIMLDTKGPEIRVHKIKNDKMLVKIGDTFKIHTKKEILGENQEFSITYKELAQTVKLKQKIMLDDGKLTFHIVDINQKTGIVTVQAENNHYVATKKAVNIPGANLDLTFLSKYDKDFIKWGIKNGIDIVAASFVVKEQDLIELRSFLNRHGGKKVKIMSKIEALKSVDNLTEIIRLSDQIMIARGDLGVEIPFERVPFYTKLIIDKCRAHAKPVTIATQMLDSMINNPKPTRAETTDIYFSGMIGVDATMLSGESASGNFPLESVQTMFLINKEAEDDFNYVSAYSTALATTDSKNADSAYKIAKLALSSDVKYIIAFSEKGRLLNALSTFRINSIIFGMLREKNLVNKYGSSYGIYAQHHMAQNDCKSDEKVRVICKKIGIKRGAKIIVANKSDYRTIRV